MSYRLIRVAPLIAKGSLLPDNWGVRPQAPKKEILLRDTVTGKTLATTDLDMKKYKRFKRLALFIDFYTTLFKKREVSLLLVVADISKYKSPKAIIDQLKEKMNKYGTIILGYYWQRDVGDIDFSPHYHLIIVVKRMEGDVLEKMQKQKRTNSYKIEMCNSLFKFKRYLTKKEIFGAPKQRSYGSSKYFRSPKTS